AAAIRAGDAAETLRLLRAGGPSVELVETADEHPTADEVAGVRADARAAGRRLVTAAREGDAATALRALDEHRVMVAHRRGPAGVAHWSDLVEAWVEEAASSAGGPAGPDTGPWYLGRPLLVTANDRETGLYNGDTGVVVADGEGGVVAVFGDPDRPLAVRPHRLPPVETVHAMTIHRGQGSQFARVSVVLPPASSPLLTRELLYTAVTRAREQVRVVGTADAVRRAVETPVRRASGLRDPLYAAASAPLFLLRRSVAGTTPAPHPANRRLCTTRGAHPAAAVLPPQPPLHTAGRPCPPPRGARPSTAASPPLRCGPCPPPVPATTTTCASPTSSPTRSTPRPWPVSRRWTSRSRPSPTSPPSPTPTAAPRRSSGPSSAAPARATRCSVRSSGPPATPPGSGSSTRSTGRRTSSGACRCGRR